MNIRKESLLDETIGKKIRPILIALQEEYEINAKEMSTEGVNRIAGHILDLYSQIDEIRLEERKKTLEEVNKEIDHKKENIIEDDQYNHRYQSDGELDGLGFIQEYVEEELSKLSKEK